MQVIVATIPNHIVPGGFGAELRASLKDQQAARGCSVTVRKLESPKGLDSGNDPFLLVGAICMPLSQRKQHFRRVNVPAAAKQVGGFAMILSRSLTHQFDLVQKP